jgi:uncharacterized protein (DUF952 family)
VLLHNRWAEQHDSAAYTSALESKDMIYHITSRETWNAAQKEGQYRGDTLASEGFIHCSGGEQVARTANRYFPGQKGLVLLEIVEAKVLPEIRFEALAGVEKFPHVYGPLNLDAVSRVIPFEPGADGIFQFQE